MHSFMNQLDQHTYLDMAEIRRDLIVLVLVISSFACILCVISISTNYWLVAQAVLNKRLSSDVNYGLFSGSLERHQLAANLKYKLNVVCDFGDSACMYSCQTSASARHEELQNVLVGAELSPCEQVQRSQYTFRTVNDTVSSPKAITSEKSLISAPVWLCVVVLVCTCFVFDGAAAGFTLLNLYTSPVERVFNIFGLYIWHGVAASCALMACVGWLVLFYAQLRYNISITDTVRQEFTFVSNDSAVLGLSFYVLVVAFLCNVLSLLILFLRRQCMLHNDAPTTVTLQPTNTPLQFY